MNAASLHQPLSLIVRANSVVSSSRIIDIYQQSTYELAFSVDESRPFCVCSSPKMVFREPGMLSTAQWDELRKIDALFKDRDNADVTIYCEGKTIMAHSIILQTGWVVLHYLQL